MMSSDNRQSLLKHITELITKIQRDTKIGTAYEKYDTKYLWKLGQEIECYSEAARNKEDGVAEILTYLNKKNVRCTPVLLKNAETTRRIWRREIEYLRDTNGTSYGKLKAILPILDPDFVSEVKLPSQEVKKILSILNEATYEEVLAAVRRIRQIYDPANLSVDLDEFYSDLHSVNRHLKSAVSKRNSKVLNYFRLRYPQRLVKDARMLIAALRSEETLKRLGKTSKLELKGIHSGEAEIDKQLLNIIKVLTSLKRGTAYSRERVRQRIGVSKLGELSTLLKAASSDEELERYNRGQELLERIRSAHT